MSTIGHEVPMSMVFGNCSWCGEGFVWDMNLHRKTCQPPKTFSFHDSKRAETLITQDVAVATLELIRVMKLNNHSSDEIIAVVEASLKNLA